jgi:hypothetical protein
MTTPTNAADGVHELVAQRDQLRGWIARLDEVGNGAPSRVAQRVRADYEERLRRVTEALSAHAEEVQRSLESLRGELDAAEERRAQAADALEETRLRHLIGELDEPAWDQARAPLEQDVAAAEEALARTRGEVERLSSLSSEISAGGAQAAAEEPVEDEGGAEPLPVFAYAPDEEDDAVASPPAAAAPVAEETAPPEDVADAADAGVSGEELAAWISEVEAEATVGEAPAEPAAEAPRAEEEPAPPAPATDASQQDADGWDPFANEFGGEPASPATQPGDATQDLPWLDALGGGAAGRWSAPPQSAGEGDELAFLDNLETSAPAAEEPAGSDLAADDLAFLEELDRAISGGTQRGGPQQPAAPAGPPSNGGFGNGFSGGSGDGNFVPAGSGETTEEPRKRGEALLCKECGAINEPQAWYCEICGSEL